MQLSIPFTIPAKEIPVPNAKELERQLRDFQNLLPQIIGSVLAIITAIGVIVGAVAPGLGSGSSNNRGNNSSPSVPGNAGNYSKPEFADAKYLHTHRSGVWDMQSGVDVTVNGKDYPKSLISTDNYDSTAAFKIEEGYTKLDYTAAWASNIPHADGVGIIEVRLNGGLRDRVLVKPGEMKQRTVDVRGGGELRIYLRAVDEVDDKKKVAPNGLAVLTPTLK